MAVQDKPYGLQDRKRYRVGHARPFSKDEAIVILNRCEHTGGASAGGEDDSDHGGGGDGSFEVLKTGCAVIKASARVFFDVDTQVSAV